MKFDMPTCGGCRTCELACSFHHTGDFGPAVSSLKVIEKADGPGYFVVVKEEKEGGGFACDGCKGLDHPLCVDYCREADDLYQMLQEFKKENLREDGSPEAGQGVHHDRE